VSQIEHDLCAALKDSPVSYPFAIPMDWRDVRSLAEAGMAVGSHTKSHDNLAMMSDDQAIRELAASKASIEEASGRQCDYLCYPYGMFHERTPRLVQQCGFTAAVSTDERGWNRAGEDRYQLKRFYLPEQRERLELMLSGLGGG